MGREARDEMSVRKKNSIGGMSMKIDEDGLFGTFVIGGMVMRVYLDKLEIVSDTEQIDVTTHGHARRYIPGPQRSSITLKLECIGAPVMVNNTGQEVTLAPLSYQRSIDVKDL